MLKVDIDALPTSKEIAELRPLANELLAEPVRFPAWRVVAACSLIAVGCVVSAYAPGWPVRLVATFIISLGFYSFDTMQHEALHGSMSANKSFNRVLGSIASFPILSCYSYYRVYHLEHHVRTAKPDDPEGWHSLTAKWQFVFVPVFGVVFGLSQLFAAFGVLFGRDPSFVRTDAQRKAIKIDCIFTLAVIVAIAYGSFVSADVRWMVLAPIGMYFLIYVPFGSAYEHYGAEESGIPEGKWNQATISRSIDLWKPQAWLFSYTSYHAAHHVFPSMPGDRLPIVDRELRKMLPPDLRCRGYARFSIRVFRSLPWRADKTAKSRSLTG
jgi:fatty acid desaturase